ncbi:MAG: Na/Pi cotransporter family protein, partial [Clostridia bacterium]|nr:Na/Pi cotransporter family protein [Clostridia bacterium]
KRTAWIHLSFNIIGTVVFLSLFVLCNWLVPGLSAFTAGYAVNPVSVAAIHTVYKILCALLLAPFPGVLEKIASLIIPNKKGEAERFELLDERLLDTPSVAVERCRSVEEKMAVLSMNIMKKALGLFFKYESSAAEEVVAGEAEADVYEDKLGTYMVKASAKSMSVTDSQELSKLLHLIGDFERISDHAVNVKESVEEMLDKKITFSDAATGELTVIIRAVERILDMSLEAFIKNDISIAAKVEPLEQVIDFLTAEVKKRHIDRLRAGGCTIELGFVLNDLLTNLERISDHCSNIAVCIIEIEKNSFDTHEYLSEIKENHQQQFEDYFQWYMEEYTLPKQN